MSPHWKSRRQLRLPGEVAPPSDPPANIRVDLPGETLWARPVSPHRAILENFPVWGANAQNYQIGDEVILDRQHRVLRRTGYCAYRSRVLEYQEGATPAETAARVKALNAYFNAHGSCGGENILFPYIGVTFPLTMAEDHIDLVVRKAPWIVPPKEPA